MQGGTMEQDYVDKRRFIRRKFPFTVYISSSLIPVISTYTQDISEGGIKVTIQKGLKTSSLVDLKVFIKQTVVECQGKIAWVNKRESQVLEDKTLFDVGIQFENISDEYKTLVERQVEILSRETDQSKS